MSRIGGTAMGTAIICLSLLTAGPVLAQTEQDRKDLQKAEFNLVLDPAASAELLQGIISKYMKEAGAAKTDILEVNIKKLNRLSTPKREILAESFYWQSYLGTGDALRDAAYAVAIAPRPRAEYFLQRGTLSAKEMPANAREDLNKALELAASDQHLIGEILEQRGRIHLAQGRTDEALSDLGRAIELAKGNPTVLAGLYESRAGAWEAKGEPNKAIQDLTAAAAASLYGEPFILKRAKLYREQEDYERALQDYGQVLKWSEEEMAGESLKEDISGALAGMLGLSAKQPELNPFEIRIEALFGRAGVYYDLDRFKDALADYDEVLRLEPDDAEAYRVRANCLRVLGDRDAALASVNKAMVLAPSKMSYYAGRADIYFSFGDWEKAAADYATYLAAHPAAWLGHQRRGVCLHNLNDLRGAIAAYERTIELNPRSVMAYNNLAWIRATSPDAGIRDGAKAVEHAKKAVELAGQEKPWLYLDTLAVAYAEAGEFRQAVDLLKKALGLMTKPEDQKDRLDMEARLKLFQAGKPYREKPGPDRRP